MVQRTFVGKNTPKSPDFEGIFFFPIFRQYSPTGCQIIGGFWKFCTFFIGLYPNLANYSCRGSLASVGTSHNWKKQPYHISSLKNIIICQKDKVGVLPSCGQMQNLEKEFICWNQNLEFVIAFSRKKKLQDSAKVPHEIATHPPSRQPK